MSIISSLKVIDEAIEGLDYRSETTLKYKLIHAIRDRYADERSLETLQTIDTEELVRSVWETGDNPELIKIKKKNFSSLKSSLNADLKKLSIGGKNPQGIIINHGNVFDISDEAKNKALTGIAAVLREKGIDAGSGMAELLAAISDLLSTAISSAIRVGMPEEIDRLKNLIGGLSGQLGLSPDKPDDGGRNEAGETGLASAPIPPMPAAGPAPAVEAPDKAPPSAGGIEAATIAGILREGGLDAAGKAGKIMAALNEVLEDAIVDASAELNADETDRIKNVFGSLAQNMESLVEEGVRPENSADEIIEEIGEADDGEVVEVVEEEIPAATDVTIATTDLEEYLPAEELKDDPLESAPAITEDALPADELAEIIEKIPDGESSAAAADGGIPQLDDAAFAAAGTDLAGALSCQGEEMITLETVAEGELADSVGEVTAADILEEVVAPFDSLAETTEAQPLNDSAEISPEPLPGEAMVAGTGADEEIVEIVEEVAEDELAEPLLADSAAADEAIVDTAALEEVDVGEEIMVEAPVAGDGDGLAASVGREYIDGELQNKAEFLNRLAEAAKALEKIGPDLSNDLYSEKEIKEKAKLLSDEFEHYLSVREKYYNQHILIKSGNYLVGGTNGGKEEFPEQIADLREFYIGKFPVTNALFELFVEKTGYITTAEKLGFGIVYTPRIQIMKNPLTGKESCIWNSRVQQRKIPGACWYRPSGPQSSLHTKRAHPVVQVGLEDACAFAAWIGKRIPTECEWEAAARTSRSYRYPWGNSWRENVCNLAKSQVGDTTPVDFYLEFANDYGVADTLGNVLEWTLDTWKGYGTGGKSKEIYVVKGASLISDAPVSLTDRHPADKNMTSNILGFRCIAI